MQGLQRRGERREAAAAGCFQSALEFGGKARGSSMCSCSWIDWVLGTLRARKGKREDPESESLHTQDRYLFASPSSLLFLSLSLHLSLSLSLPAFPLSLISPSIFCPGPLSALLTAFHVCLLSSPSSSSVSGLPYSAISVARWCFSFPAPAPCVLNHSLLSLHQTSLSKRNCSFPCLCVRVNGERGEEQKGNGLRPFIIRIQL